MKRQAIILAGGFGTRLRGLLGDTPKVLAPVCGRPFLAYLLDELEQQAFDRVILAVGHRREAIRAAFGSSYRTFPLTYSEEETPLGTGGAIRKALVEVDDEPCFVINGDSWLDLNYGVMLDRFMVSRSQISIAVRRVEEVGRFGSVAIEGDRIKRFREKVGGGAGYINSGVYLIRPSLLSDYAPGDTFSFERDFLGPNVERLAPIAFESGGRFIDIGTPEDYSMAEVLFREGKN
jgi:D-glycero-alpha-D-manno-heptose 1-phosphate guanylyltransferase